MQISTHVVTKRLKAQPPISCMLSPMKIQSTYKEERARLANLKRKSGHFPEEYLRSITTSRLKADQELLRAVRITIYLCLTRWEEALKTKSMLHLLDLLIFKANRCPPPLSQWAAKFSTISPSTACLCTTSLSLTLGSTARNLDGKSKVSWLHLLRTLSRRDHLMGDNTALLTKLYKVWPLPPAQHPTTGNNLGRTLKILRPTMSSKSGC